MDRPLQIRDAENISLEASDENSDMYPHLVAQFTCQHEAVSDCINLLNHYVCCSVVWMMNVTHAAIEDIKVTVTTPHVSGVILQQCSHLHIQSITYSNIQEQNNGRNDFMSNEYGNIAYESSDIEMESLEASNFSYGVLLYKSRNTSMTNVSAAYNEHNGIHLYYSTDTSMTNVSAAYNEHNGIHLYYSTDTSMTNVSTAHNEYNGIILNNCTDTTITNITAAHNGYDGILLYHSTETNMIDIYAVHNQHSGIALLSAINNYITNTTSLIIAYNAQNLVLNDTSFSDTYAPSTASSTSEPTSLPAVITLYNSTTLL